MEKRRIRDLEGKEYSTWTNRDLGNSASRAVVIEAETAYSRLWHLICLSALRLMA